MEGFGSLIQMEKRTKRAEMVSGNRCSKNEEKVQTPWPHSIRLRSSQQHTSEKSVLLLYFAAWIRHAKILSGGVYTNKNSGRNAHQDEIVTFSSLIGKRTWFKSHCESIKLLFGDRDNMYKDFYQAIVTGSQSQLITSQVEMSLATIYCPETGNFTFY